MNVMQKCKCKCNQIAKRKHCHVNGSTVKDFPQQNAYMNKNWWEKMSINLCTFSERHHCLFSNWLRWHFQQCNSKLKRWVWSHVLYSQHRSATAFNLHFEHSTHWSAAACPSWWSLHLTDASFAAQLDEMTKSPKKCRIFFVKQSTED